jgi:hypothetical protein
MGLSGSTRARDVRIDPLCVGGRGTEGGIREKDRESNAASEPSGRSHCRKVSHRQW